MAENHHRGIQTGGFSNGILVLFYEHFGEERDESEYYSKSYLNFKFITINLNGLACMQRMKTNFV